MSAQPDVVIGRTEIEVAADTIAALLAKQVLPNRIAVLRQATEAAGLIEGDVAAARQRYKRRGFLRPTRVLADTLAPVPEDSPTHFNKGRQPWNRTPDAARRRCNRCGKVQPIDNFAPRSDQNGRRTDCNDCRKKYQSERYLSVEKSARLGTVLRFIVEAGDACIGGTCPRCHQSIKTGDEVQSDDVVLHHFECPKAK